ncbi:MAG: PRC-barrel domain-containing protein, partial [Actinobacteria bacterium]|nr:PRC-barrel domain-containing protein [Actinomycetota bacterium]
MATSSSPSGPDWEGQTMLDRAGQKIGTIEEIYLVEETGRPEWALVKTGRLGSRTTMVPLAGADRVAEGVRARYDKTKIAEAPPIDAGDDPSEEEVAALYRHYEMDTAAPASLEPTSDRGDGDGDAAATREQRESRPPQAGGSRAHASSLSRARRSSTARSAAAKFSIAAALRASASATMRRISSSSSVPKASRALRRAASSSRVSRSTSLSARMRSAFSLSKTGR